MFKNLQNMQTSHLFLVLNKFRLSVLEANCEAHKQPVLPLMYMDIGINIKQGFV